MRMADNATSPRSPLVGGEEGNPPQPPLVRGGVPTAPSPDKGRAGEGLERAGKGGKTGAEFAFLPYNKKLTALARENRKNPTPAESLIWHRVLRSRQFLHYKFLRQKPIAGYIVDFYCAELRLVVEIDGESHVGQVAYDAERTRLLNALGLRVVRYANCDVMRDVEGVFADLSRRVETLTGVQSENSAPTARQ